MTTVNAMYTKINGSWVESSGGMATEVACPNVSSTNSSSFKVGECTINLNSYTNPSSVTSNYAWTTISGTYTPASSSPTITSCPPFVITSSSASVVFTANLTVSSSNWGTPSAGLKALRVKDSSVLGSWTGSLSVPQSTKSGTISTSVTLPSDWDYTTDKIMFQFYAYWSNSTKMTASSGQTIVSASSVSSDLYYNPVVSS